MAVQTIFPTPSPRYDQGNEAAFRRAVEEALRGVGVHGNEMHSPDFATEAALADHVGDGAIHFPMAEIEIGRSQVTDLFGAPFWGEIPDLPTEFHPEAHGLLSDRHTVSGLTAGHVLTATGPTSVAFQEAPSGYDRWKLLINEEVSGGEVESQDEVRFVAGSGITLDRTGNEITISGGGGGSGFSSFEVRGDTGQQTIEDGDVVTIVGLGGLSVGVSSEIDGASVELSLSLGFGDISGNLAAGQLPTGSPAWNATSIRLSGSGSPRGPVEIIVPEASAYAPSDSFLVGGGGTGDMEIRFGRASSGHAWIQSIEAGVSFARGLALQPNGGWVAVGTVSPGNAEAGGIRAAGFSHFQGFWSSAPATFRQAGGGVITLRADQGVNGSPVGEILFYNERTSGVVGSIKGVRHNSDFSSSLDFYTRSGGSEERRMRLRVLGELLLGTTSPGDATGGGIRTTGDNDFTGGISYFSDPRWSSDRELKYNIWTIHGDEALERILGLRPIDFAWRENDRLSKGFLAQEAFRISERYGSETTLNPMAILGDLVAAVQHLEAQIRGEEEVNPA